MIIITRERWADWLEAFYRTHQIESIVGPAGSKDPQGTAYTALTHFGEKVEGEQIPVGLLLKSQEGVEWALDLYEKVLLKWLDGRKYIIWKEMPNAHVQPHNIVDYDSQNDCLHVLQEWYFYCRLSAYRRRPMRSKGDIGILSRN